MRQQPRGDEEDEMHDVHDQLHCLWANNQPEAVLHGMGEIERRLEHEQYRGIEHFNSIYLKSDNYTPGRFCRCQADPQGPWRQRLHTQERGHGRRYTLGHKRRFKGLRDRGLAKVSYFH